MSLVVLAYASLAKPGQPQRITDQDGCTLLYSQCGNRTWTVITMAIFLSFIIVAISQLPEHFASVVLAEGLAFNKRPWCQGGFNRQNE